jgi:ATP-dependent Clp protease ATP-binding subunit ClpA
MPMVWTTLPGYEACVTRVFQILLQREEVRNKYNPLLLDTDGIGRWRIIIEIARRMAEGEAPDPLATWQVVALNYEALFADPLDSFSRNSPPPAPRLSLPSKSEWDKALADSGSEHLLDQLFMSYSSRILWPSWEERRFPNTVLSRLQTIFLAIRRAGGKVLLFVNHFHRLLGGEQQPYSIDASSLLKPILARREIQLIGACMPDQYQQYSERDSAIARRLQELYIELDKEFQGS